MCGERYSVTTVGWGGGEEAETRAAVYCLVTSAGESALDRGQGPAGHAAGPNQQYLRPFKPQRPAGAAAYHPLPVIWGDGEDADPGGPLQALLQFRQVGVPC